jgi:hypothetical protein
VTNLKPRLTTLEKRPASQGEKEPRKKDLGWEGHGRARYMACLFGEARRSQNTCIWVPNGVGTKFGVEHDAVCR